MWPLIAVAAWIAVLLAVGVVKSRRVRDQAGFALAGRSLGLPVLLGTLLATWTGTGSIFGSAEKAYETGFAALVLPFGPVAGFLVLIVLAGRVRARGAFTLQDLLEERFGPAARALGTLTLVTAYVVIVSYQFRAAAVVLERLVHDVGWFGDLAAEGPPGSAFVTAPGWHAAVLVTVALVIAAYTALAGMASVAVTDAFNGVLMTIGLFCALPVAWSLAGGPGAVVAALPPEAREVTSRWSASDLVALTLPTFLLVLGDANLHARFLSARSDRAARTAAALLIPAVLLIDGSILLLAIAGRVLLPGLPAGGHVIFELALRAMPAALGALLVATIVAVIVSTADSYLLSSATSLLRDVYQRFVRPEASERERLLVARLLVAGVAALALGLAFLGGGFFDVAFLAYTIYGCGITPVLLAALFWPRVPAWAAVAAMLAATATVLQWSLLGAGSVVAAATGQAWVADLDAVVPGAVVAFGVLGLGRLIAPRPRPLALAR